MNYTDTLKKVLFLSFHCFILQHLLCQLCLDTVLGTGSTVKNKTEAVPALMRAAF